MFSIDTMRRLRCSVAAVALGTFATAASALPDVVLNGNPGFESGLDGWILYVQPGGNIAWVPDAIDGAGGSVVVSGPPGQYILYSCFDGSKFPPYARAFRTEVTTLSAGSSARLFASATFGFAGDMGETGDCVGPATESYWGMVDAWLDPPGLTRHVSASREFRYPGPLVTFSIHLYKFDDSDIRLDDARFVVDADLAFRSDFE